MLPESLCTWLQALVSTFQGLSFSLLYPVPLRPRGVRNLIITRLGYERVPRQDVFLAISKLPVFGWLVLNVLMMKLWIGLLAKKANRFLNPIATLNFVRDESI